MATRDWLFWVITALKSSLSRSALTSTGIAIGICAVILLTSIGEGVRVYLLDSFAQFGTRIIAVTPGKTDTSGMPNGLVSTVRPLSLDDAWAMKRLPHVDYVVPVVQGTGRIEAGEFARDTDIYGVGSQMAEEWDFKVGAGRFLPEDEEGVRYVTVLGSKVKHELFGFQNALGAFVRIGGARFRVIGVMAEKGQLLGFDLDDAVYVPAALGLTLFNRPGLMEIDIVYRESTTASGMSDRVTSALMDRHGEEDFTLFTQEDMLNSLDRILSMLKLAIGALGSVALVVGGVGVLTIMSMALRERVPEIGLLRALGCTQQQILWLFLGEAVVLSAAGGLLGLSIVFVLAGALRIAVPGLPIDIQMQTIALAMAISGGVGLIAGIAPALGAARLNPVDALRSE